MLRALLKGRLSWVHRGWRHQSSRLPLINKTNTNMPQLSTLAQLHKHTLNPSLKLAVRPLKVSSGSYHSKFIFVQVSIFINVAEVPDLHDKNMKE